MRHYYQYILNSFFSAAITKRRLLKQTESDESNLYFEVIFSQFSYIFPKRNTETQNKLVLLVIECTVDALNWNAENLNFNIFFFVGELIFCAKFSIRQIHTSSFVRSFVYIFFATITTSLLCVSLFVRVAFDSVRFCWDFFACQFRRQLQHTKSKNKSYLYTVRKRVQW